ncbi:MAG: stage III sporulation protein AF [Clostridia bacterium]|nr:stage III sporulation protein AF [Clostridia bacterium]
MNTYTLTILTVSLVGGIINSLVASNNGLKKYISYIVSLVCVVCLISPIGSLIGNIANIKSNINDYVEEVFSSDAYNNSNSLIINTGKEKVCEGVKEIIKDRYGFDDNEVIVDLELDETNIQAIKIEKINIILTGKASWSDVNTVEEYIKDMVGCDISVKRK